MKKYVVLFLLIVCISSLLGCAQQKADTFPTFPILQPTGFTEFLDNENFLPGTGQGTFRSQMDKYSYEGTPISEGMGLHYDGPSGGGYSLRGKKYGFSNDYTVNEADETATYSNRFYTNVALDGLSLPYGMTFDDTLAIMLQKLNIDVDPQSDFVSDKENEGAMTLQSDDSSSLVLINYLLLPDRSEKQIYDFELVYTERYQTTREDGSVTNVTRSIILSFSDENYKLGKFDVSVVETYKIY